MGELLRIKLFPAEENGLFQLGFELGKRFRFIQDQRNFLDFLEPEIDVRVQVDQGHIFILTIPPSIIGLVVIFNQEDVRGICLLHGLFGKDVLFAAG